MNDTTLANALRTSLLLAGLFCGFAVAGVQIAAWIRVDAWRKRPQYVLLAGILSFLCGASMSALVFIDTPDFRALPILFLLSLACGFGGAFFVFYNMWSAKWWSKWRRRYMKRLADSETEEGE